jgi:hypothetical protein
MYAIYGNIYHQYTPFMLAYIPAPWILWVRLWKFMEILDVRNAERRGRRGRSPTLGMGCSHQNPRAGGKVVAQVGWLNWFGPLFIYIYIFIYICKIFVYIYIFVYLYI